MCISTILTEGRWGKEAGGGEAAVSSLGTVIDEFTKIIVLSGISLVHLLILTHFILFEQPELSVVPQCKPPRSIL